MNSRPQPLPIIIARRKPKSWEVKEKAKHTESVAELRTEVAFLTPYSGFFLVSFTSQYPCYHLAPLENTWSRGLLYCYEEKSELQEDHPLHSLLGSINANAAILHHQTYPGTLIEGKRRREQQRMRWLACITSSMDINLSKVGEIVKEREAWTAAVHGVAKSWTRLSNWTTIPEHVIAMFTKLIS